MNKILKSTIKSFILFGIIIIIYIGILIILPFNDFSPQQLCLFKNITGVPCPGCGLTRSYLALLKGNISHAFYYHPLFFVVPLSALLIIFMNVTKNKLHKKNSNIALTILVCLIIILYIIRMSTMFPHTPPMDYNPNSLVPSIYYYLKNTFF